jgi:riboflavin kinase/FMN adenylyltransferase
LLEVHCLDWTDRAPTLAASHATLPPGGAGLDSAYGKIIRVELLHKLHDELKYDGLDALQKGIARDCDDARAFFAALQPETSLDRI